MTKAGSQSSGFFAGEKPSRNHASANPCHSGGGSPRVADHDAGVQGSDFEFAFAFTPCGHERIRGHANVRKLRLCAAAKPLEGDRPRSPRNAAARLDRQKSMRRGPRACSARFRTRAPQFGSPAVSVHESRCPPGRRALPPQARLCGNSTYPGIYGSMVSGGWTNSRSWDSLRVSLPS